MKHLAMAVVIRNHQVLIQKRFRPETGTTTGFPGGALIRGENPVKAAFRELREETGICDLEKLSITTLPDEQGRHIHFVVLKAVSGTEPEQPDTASRQFYWVSQEALPLTEFFPADRYFIRRVLPDYLL